MGSVDQLPANHIDKTISNVVVEDVDSKIIMANVVLNANKNDTSTHLISGSPGNIDNVIGNTLEAFEEKRRETLKSNASIINVDNDCYELIPSRCFPESEFRGFHKSIEEIKENIYSSENNICKLFVKEGTPPKVRKKEHMIGNFSNLESLNSLEVMNENKKDDNEKEKHNESEAKPDEIKAHNYSFDDHSSFPVIHSLAQSNAECHKTEFAIEDHQNDVLQGLNDLRIDGSFLDVTLWAENQPFQVGIALILIISFLSKISKYRFLLV